MYAHVLPLITLRSRPRKRPPGYVVRHSPTRGVLPLAVGLAAGLGFGAPLSTTARAQNAAGANVAGAARQPAPERLVAEATIREVSDGMFKYVFLPVEIRGRAMSLILDVGASAGVVLSSWAVDNWGGAIPNALDSLVLGTNVERNVPVLATRFSKEVPPGMPPLAGLLGTDVLSHYDLLFDGPARRVRLYLPPPNASPDSAAHRPTWFPPGLTSAECTPMIQVSDPPIPRRVEFSMLANGKPVTGFFDSGAKRNNMGLSTAEALGIDTTSPNVRLLPGGIPGAFPLARVSQRVWEVHDVTLVLGKYHFTNSPVSLRLEYPTGTDSPFIGVGLDAISDRLLFVSYSTGQVCLGEPH